jgi:hypothetical protein
MAEVKTIKIDVDTKQAVNAMDNLAQATHDVSASFADVYGEIQPLTARMGEAEDRLYELAAAGKTTTKEYQDLLQTVGNYRKVQIKTDMAVDAASTTMGQKLGGALNGVAAGFSLAQGVMGAFGVESEAVEKALLKVQSALAIQQGFKGITESLPFFTDLKNNAISAFKGMTVASRAFMTAGIGILIVGIGLLIENFDKIANVFTGEIERNARYTKALNQSAKAIKDNAKELDKRAEDLQRNQDFEYAMAEAQGATTAELRKMKVAQAEERIELEKDSVARAENIYWLAKQRYQKLVNLEADEELIKKAKENAVQARETLVKEKEDLNQARQDRKDIINQNKVDETKDRQDRIQAGKDAAKEELTTIKDNQKSATELLKEESQRQIDAIEAKYAEQIKLAKKYGKDIKALEEARNKELKDITDKQVDLSRGGNEQVKIATISSIKTTKEFQEQQKVGLVGVQEVRERIFQREKAIDEAKKKAQEDALNATANTLGQIADLFGRQTAAGKAAAIAEATIQTFVSAQKAYTSTIGIPVVGPVLAPINAGLAIAAGIKNIKAITAVQTPDGGGGGGGNLSNSFSGSAAQAPSFNVVGNSGINQLAQLQQQPMQAYVVSGSVTTAQSLDRNRIENATL